MSGAIVGLEWPALLQLIPPGADHDRVVGLLREWEAGVLAGTAEKAKDSSKGKR